MVVCLFLCSFLLLFLFLFLMVSVLAPMESPKVDHDEVEGGDDETKAGMEDIDHTRGSIIWLILPSSHSPLSSSSSSSSSSTCFLSSLSHSSLFLTTPSNSSTLLSTSATHIHNSSNTLFK